MLKNYKTKLVGLVMIMMFICSVIPTGSAVEQRKATVNELLISNTLPELVDVLSDNVTERKKLKEVLADPHNLYGYFTKTLGCNLTLANFQKLNEVLQNQTNSEDYGIFVAYQIDPNTIVTYKGREGTAQELYESVPHLQDMFAKYETSVKNFGQMDSYDQWLWLNTEDVTTDSVKELYEKADDDLKAQMLMDSYTSFNKLVGLEDRSLGWLLDNVDTIKNDGEEAIYNFNHKSTYRYDNPDPLMSYTVAKAGIDASTQKLIDAYNTTSKVADYTDVVTITLIGLPAALLVTGVIIITIGAAIEARSFGLHGAAVIAVGVKLLYAGAVCGGIAIVAIITWSAVIRGLLDHYADLLKGRGIDVDDPAYHWG
jgi:hypothetical protein